MPDPFAAFSRVDVYAERLRHLPLDRPRLTTWLAAALSTALLAAILVVLFRSMRLVMDVGGSCAAGGPYEIATPCPDGVVPLIAPAIPLGFVAGAACALFGARLGRGAAALVAFAWPLLFLSLGWNFLEYGLGFGHDEGLVWGWLVCAMTFVLLGLPGVFVVPSIVRGVRDRRAAVLCVLGASAVAGGVGGWLLVGVVA